MRATRRPARRAVAVATVAALLLLVVAAALVDGRVPAIVPVLAGYEAKVLASGVFVGGRSIEDVIGHDLAHLPVLRFLRAHVDAGRREVSVSLAGLWTRRARCAVSGGCVLLPDVGDEPLPAGVPVAAGPRAAVDPVPALDPAQPWPAGEGPPAHEAPAPLARALEAAFDEPADGPRRRTRAVVVIHAGRLLAERYAPGITPRTPLPGWSMAKSVVNALCGALARRGRLALDAPVPLAEWSAPGDPRRAITWRQMLQMSSGLAFDEDYADPRSDISRALWREADAGAVGARQPLLFPPGTRFAYAGGTSNAITRAWLALFPSRADYLAFPREALFVPLGAPSLVLETDASGSFVGSSFVHGSARDWARFGQLYVDDGVVRGRRILPPGWAAFSGAPAPAAPRGTYGAHFWRDATGTLPPDTFFARGFGGQAVVIVPSRRAVIVRLAAADAGEAGVEPLVRAVLDALPPAPPEDAR